MPSRCVSLSQLSIISKETAAFIPPRSDNSPTLGVCGCEVVEGKVVFS